MWGTAASATPFVAKTPPLLLGDDKITAQPSTEYNAISLRPMSVVFDIESKREREIESIQKEGLSQFFEVKHVPIPRHRPNIFRVSKPKTKP